MKSSQSHPPKCACRLLEWFAGHAHIEDLQGDLEEVFYDEINYLSPLRAKFNYTWQVLSLIFSYALKKRQVDQSYHPLSFTQNNTAMFRNYVKVALRSLARNKFFTLINVVGLALGMSITILFIGATGSVLRYDKFHENYENIYRIVSILDEKTSLERQASSPAPISTSIQEKYTGFDKTVRVNSWASGDITYGNKVLPMWGLFTEPAFFDMFSFNMLDGNPETALEKPFQIVLTTRSANKLFSGADPIGKLVSLGDFGDFTVSGVVADIPKGSHLSFHMLVSYSTLAILERDRKISVVSNEWHSFRDNYTYVQLNEEQIPEIKQALNNIAANRYKDGDKVTATFDLQPMGDIVTTWEDHRNDIAPYFGGMTLYAFGAITLLILLPACFNYTNISISRAMKRAKEIGVRKVVGGYKKQIWYQFITETILICLIALIGSVGIFFFVKNRFIDMLGFGFTLDFEITTAMMIAFIVFAIITGFLAGVVPASYFSKIDPVTALKGSSNLKIFGKTNFKKVLLVSQFSLSLFFIMGVAVQFKQLYYSINYDLGFNQDNLIDVDLQDADKAIFRNEFSKHSAVRSISMSSHVLGTQSFDQSWLHYTDRKDSVGIQQMFVDPNYITNLGLNIVAGKDFDENTTHDENGIIINETFYINQGYTNAIDALDQTFVLPNGKEVKVIGVVKDFNYALLRSPINHFVLRYNPEYFRYANIKVNTSDHFTMLSDMETTWNDLGQEQKFEAKFLNKEIEEAFLGYTAMIEIYGFLGFLAITIASLGLLGMVVYSTESRSKEVGVRKVMGASVKSLVYILSKEYLHMMVLSSVFAIPAGYFFFNALMSQTQYFSVRVGLIDILLSVLLLLFIGGVTLASQTIKTALSNPTDTLQYE